MGALYQIGETITWEHLRVMPQRLGSNQKSAPGYGSRRTLAGSLCAALLLAAVLPGAEPAKPAAKGEEAAQHWAYRPVSRPAVPVVKNAGAVQTPIDGFILAPLEERGLDLSPEAGKRELLRRAKLDLVGLPPTPAEIADFVADTSTDAYERLLDRLLGSTHYGERWGRMWLDVVRFADTAGYNADPLRPLAYKYRDYVIQAFNRDIPYDRFVQEQLAGDELFPDSADALIAAGFNRLPADESNASDVLLARQDNLNDLTSGVGSIFLAQSLGCAQCHDHKFDPIPQKDYYRLQAFFAGLIPVESVPLMPAAEYAKYLEQVEAWRAGTDAVRTELHQLEASARAAAWKEKRERFPEVVWKALSTPPERRTALQHQLAFYSERQIDVTEKNTIGAMTPEQKQRRQNLKDELDRRLTECPKPPQSLAAMSAVDGTQTPLTHLLAGGAYTKPLEEVQPGFLSVLSPGASSAAPAAIVPPRPGTTGRRTALAKWITDPAHPLTARVLVNRLWQGHFGRGLVKNANDFGVQTPPPSHPELLDWLAAEFVTPQEPGQIPWSMKRMHKLIMLSAVYRQSSERDRVGASPSKGIAADPGNVFYWHFPRRRLDAEMLRDSLLAVSGQLNVTMYGPGVRPELPPNFSARESWPVSPNATDRQRRSVYIQAKRNLPYPLLQAFDLPDMHESCACRQLTTTGPQALTLLNSETVLGYAQNFASELLEENPHAERDRLVEEAYQRAFGRSPDSEELRQAAAFIVQQQNLIAPRLSAGEQILLPRGMPKFLDPALAAAVVDFCHALLNANEFIYVD